MDFCLRPATPDGAAALATVEVTSCRAAYRGQLPDVFLDGLPEAEKTVDWRQNLLRHGPSGRKRVYVAVDDAGLIGFAGVGPAWDKCKVGLVYLLYVLPAYWGGGIGNALMRGYSAAHQRQLDLATHRCTVPEAAQERIVPTAECCPSVRLAKRTGQLVAAAGAAAAAGVGRAPGQIVPSARLGYRRACP